MIHLNNDIKPISIGELTLPHNIVPAPLAGISDYPFRELARSFGAGLTFAEMISVSAWKNNPDKTRQLLKIRPHEHPIGIQLLGKDPQLFAGVVPEMEEFQPDLLDVNLACPMKKVVKSGMGAALLSDPEKVYDIMGAVCGATARPVTAKIRLLQGDQGVMADVISAIRSAGASAIMVHGRTREQGYAGGVDLQGIAAVKVLAGIPVFGSGNLFSVRAAKKMFERTGVDGLMLARGLLGRPWLLKEILEPPPERDLLNPLEVLREHYRLQADEYGELRAVRRMRKLLPNYLKQVKGGEELKARLLKAETVYQVEKLLAVRPGKQVDY